MKEIDMQIANLINMSVFQLLLLATLTIILLTPSSNKESQKNVYHSCMHVTKFRNSINQPAKRVSDLP